MASRSRPPAYTGYGMVVLVIIVLLLALTGTLWTVVKISIAVAMGITLAVVLLAGLIGWRVRKALRSHEGGWRRVPGSSRIEVLDHRHDHDHDH